MAISPVGKRKFAAFAVILIFNLAVLALAASVNNFQGFFYAADILPLVISVITLAVLLLSLLADLCSTNGFLSRPKAEVPLLASLSMLWLISNAFSTSRWSGIPSSCSASFSDEPDLVSWCNNVHALTGLIWVVLVILLLTTICILKFTISESRRGNPYIWTTSLSRYNLNANMPIPETPINEVSSFYRGSSLFNFGGKIRSTSTHKKSTSIASRDFFAAPPVAYRNSDSSSAFGGGKAGVGSPFNFRKEHSPTSANSYQARYEEAMKGFDIVVSSPFDEDMFVDREKH